jgi:long-chain acyl-CoA synthetase
VTAGAVFAPNRVEWMSAALGLEAAGGVMVPVYPASTAEQAAYILEHSDAKVVFVDTPALLARLFAASAALANVETVVTLDDAVDPGKVADSAVEKGLCSREAAEALRERVVRWSSARAQGRAKLVADPTVCERSMNGDRPRSAGP